MRLRASIVPPLEAVNHLAAAVRDSSGEQDQLVWTPSPHWTLHLARFGNVSRGDAQHIDALVADHVAGFAPVNLWLGGVVPLPEDGDNSVYVGVHGDTDAVAELAFSLPAIVKPAGFLLDRRSFRPRIQLAKVTVRTTVPYLEHLESRLGAYQGPAFTAGTISLGYETSIGDGDSMTFEFTVSSELPLAGVRL